MGDMLMPGSDQTVSPDRPGAEGPETAGGRRPRVAVLHQGCVPVYRRRFFELLNERSDIEYVVFHGDPPAWSAIQVARGPFTFPNVPVRNRYLRVFNRYLAYQPVLMRILLGGFAGAVLGHEVKFVSNVLLTAVFRMLGKPVIHWGFGYHKETGDKGHDRVNRAVLGALEGIKLWYARLADGYLTYTDEGADYLIRSGFPAGRVWVLRNTIDMEAQVAMAERLQARDGAAVRAELGLADDSVVFLYVGRLLPDKRVDLLLDAVDILAAEAGSEAPPEAVIIGDGPERQALERRAAGRPNVRFTGNLDPDDERIGKFMKIAAAVVIPGYVGLAVNHAFAHGVPVITRADDFHSPEVDYIRHGENGLIVDGDVDAFVAALRDVAGSAPLRRGLAAGALASRGDLGLGTMVARFDGAVVEVLSNRRG